MDVEILQTQDTLRKRFGTDLVFALTTAAIVVPKVFAYTTISVRTRTGESS